ncbi:hypothetical protein [Pontibacter beigongshangensis]|uniref:hypothetical protein n=1 Tax=Pontibacter beigongshangensis TaxID=2574733 RepID=UPI00164FC535|nr:hypothetical protein [Pontibacter beigongshangensis]
MKKKLIAMAMVCLCFTGVKAQQDERLASLMEEREQLVMEYQFYNQQNSNFWGKKSKADLMAIIETLKKIINKDSELISAVKAASIKKVAENTVEIQRSGKQVQVDQRQINERIAGLQSQINTLESQLKKRERTMQDIRAELAASDDRRYGKDKVIAILAVAAFIIFLYAVLLQIRLGKALATGKKKKSR